MRELFSLPLVIKPFSHIFEVNLTFIGIYPQIPLGLAWNGGNIGGSLKRGTGIAMQVMGGNCGGIIASYVYLSKNGPRYACNPPSRILRLTLV